MECEEEEEEDANSLLSLSQTFLQPDSSSASMGLSTNQLHNWSALTSAATEVAGQFSPISPVDGYNTSINTGHVLTDNEANVRFYGARSSTSQSATRSSVPALFSRSVNSSASASISNNYSSTAKVSGSDFKHGAGHIHLDTSTDLCYDQACGSRSNTNLYVDKDTGYSGCSGLNVSSNSLHVNASNVIAASFAHSEYSDEHMLSLTSTSDKLGNRNIQLDQKNFEPRCKQQDYGKDLSNLYEQSAEKHHSTEINMPFDRRDSNAFDNSFEFSSDSRDFMSSGRLDVTSVSRGIQDADCHDSQKYTGTQLGDGSVLSGSLSLDSKRVVSSCMNFGMTGHVEDAYGRLSSSQKKSMLTHQLSDLSTDLDPVFHGYHTDFGGHQKISFDNHRNFVSNEFHGNEDTSRFDIKGQANFKDSNSKWSGRPRAHRKMARLLGSEDHRNYLQTAETNSSHKSSFPKSVSALEPASQDKSSYAQSAQKNLTSSRTFLTVEEELDLRTNHHQQRNFISRRQENDNRQHLAQRDFSLLHNASTFLFDSSTIASSMHKDTSSILASQQFLPSAQLELDFHSSLSVSQSQKDLDLNQHFGLQVLKGLEGPHPVSNQDDFSFDPSGDAPHGNQAELSLPDNLGIGSHVQPELNFEAYFNSTSDRDFTSNSDRDFSAASDRDLTFCRKLSASTTRDLNYAPNASVSDFNIEDYMNPQTQRDLSQSYFERTDVPQDMTVYQKTPIDKASMPETLTSFKGREKNQSIITNKEKQGEISELQKELTKTSTKESLKGIRIPRDINRAMEILQGLQEDEREEERRKELQQRQQYQQHQQMQGLISSPKKTFQNKHNIENSSLTDQQLLGSSGSFMVDHSVGSFLDHSHLSVQEQPSDGLQMVQSYQPLTQMHQPLEVDMVSTLSTKRDLQQNLTQHMASELDYHIFKRLACSTSLKNATTQGSCFSNNSNNLASILDDSHTSNSEMQFQVAGLHYQTQPSDLDDVVSNSILNGSGQNTLELNRSKNDVTFMDFEPPQPQHIISEKLQTPVVADNQAVHSSVELGQDIYAKQQTEVLISSRKNLYDMMKQEQFCDAVLSTSKQTIKVHQIVLCSMSQYLTALLQKMKPQMPSYTAHATTSSASFTSQTTKNDSVLLVVNCDGIKSSSMMAFLVYIYLGRAELSENNVLDMYMLACSLRVPTLKDICTEFMWQAHIPNEQVKVPQLIVSIQRFEMQEQATNTEVSTEDKFTNTSFSSKGMEVATQTDRSTSKAGEGSQEEWVMLKKTKQKTVSPSKSRLFGKSLTVTDSPGSCKAGKKGWLSPKRRYKTENQIEGKVTEKEVVFYGKEISSTFPAMVNGSNSEVVNQSDTTQSRFSYSSISDIKTKDNKHESVSQNDGTSENKPVCDKSTVCVSKQPLLPKKSARTTVEIAAAAAAAKLAVHSYSTRTARGTMKTPVSYAFLASGLEKKKPVVNVKEKTTSAMSKKKDFIKSNPQADFNHHSETGSVNESDSLTVLLENNFMTCANTSSQFEPQCVKPTCLSSQTGSEYVPGSLVQLKADTEAFKSSVKRPFKKSIVHRSRSEEVLNKNCVQLASSLATRTDVQGNNESDFMDSYLIDSFVSTIECDNTDVDLQKVINDLDTFTKSPLLTTASSSISSTSLTSPLKSPTALVTPDFTSPVKSRSTPQGFRKRLIHQINSEKNGSSSFLNFHTENVLPNASSSTSPDNSTMVSTSETGSVLTSVSTTATLSLVPVSPPFTTSLITGHEEACQSISSDDKLLTVNKDMGQSSSITNSEPGRDQVATTFTEAVDELALSLYSLEEETDLMLGSKASSFSSMTDIELGLKDDSGGHFFHKLFKRKRKAKARKPTAADSESIQMKPKVKKQQMSESEGSLAKPRPRKAAGSDTEGSGTRSKQKKCVFSENEGALAKVRPPPKKRAKMELELLRAGEPDNRSDTLSAEAEEISRDKATKNSITTDTKSDSSSESTGIREEILKSEMKKSGEGLKKRSPRSTVAENHVTPLSELEVTMETKMTLMLEELAKTLNLKTRQFSCKLCHTKMRSARRTVRHLQSHSVNLEDALENIAVGEKEVDQEACDICGYRTKDRSYHYMHLHKYFKHGVSLPLGWSTDKCEVCGKECFTKFQLKEHMMSHDDSHCFVCWHCGQSFKMRNSLNSHVFHKHSDIRKHQCKACGKTFKTWTQLKVHVRSHTGEKPFSCIDCEHRSTTQGNMKLHLSTHGYSKEKINKIMEKICKDVPEMDPEALEQVMINIAEKVRTEQMTVKEKKSKKKPSTPKPSTNDHVNHESNSPAKTTPEDSSRKRSQDAAEQQDTDSGSKFAGSQIKRLLTQPLSQMKPPKFILPQLSQSAETGSNSNEESGQSQVLCDSSDSSLNTLSLLLQTQTQKQDPNGLYGGTFLITLPYSDQQQQQQQRPQTVDSLSSMMGYTVIPTYILPNQTRAETLIDSSTGLALSMFSASDILSSGLSMLQPGIQSAELVQSSSIYANTSSSIIQCAPGSDAAHLLATSQGHEIQQDIAVTNLQYPDSKIVVIDSTQQENKPDACTSLSVDNGTSTGCSTTVVVLPTESSCSKKRQPLRQQTQTVFNYSPLIASSQSVLMPVAPLVQIIPSSLDTSNFVNFSVTASIPEDVAALHTSEPSFEDVTAETEHMLTESQEQATSVVTVTHPD